MPSRVLISAGPTTVLLLLKRRSQRFSQERETVLHGIVFIDSFCLMGMMESIRGFTERQTHVVSFVQLG